jgi:hypothetical protein
LRAVLGEFAVYYNTARPHQGIARRVPDEDPGHPVAKAIERNGQASGRFTTLLSARLEADLLHCFAARPDDLLAPTADPDEFSRFLAAHPGFAVLPEESNPRAG